LAIINVKQGKKAISISKKQLHLKKRTNFGGQSKPFCPLSHQVPRSLADVQEG
jgi:hypothetical protein